MLPNEGAAFVTAIVALLLGALFGFVVHRTSASLKYNGEWPNVPRFKKVALGLSGSIAALVAGLWVLSDAASFQPERLLARLWLWQTLAAWLGGLAIDEFWRRTKGGGS